MSNDGGVVSGELFEKTRAELIVQFRGVSFLFIGRATEKLPGPRKETTRLDPGCQAPAE